jgi:adenine deaminase
MQISGNIVDVVSNKIFPGIVTVRRGRIIDIKKTEAKYDNYILPGLVDAHIHIESSLLCPSRFAETVAPFGTAATVSDPHEIANVLGIKGVAYMVRDAKNVPLKIFFTAPSCVPATLFESNGADLDALKIEKLLRKENVVALGEMMNYPGVIFEDKGVMEKIKTAHKLKKPIDGHCPALSGADLKKYASFCISTEHEAVSVSEAKEKIKAGMKIMIRVGSSANQFDDLIDLVKEGHKDGMFVSDDRHPEDLKKGHIDLILRRAVSAGVDPLLAIRMVTYNPVRHYKLPLGLLQKNDPADFIVVDNLKNFSVLENYVNGKLIAKNGKALFRVTPLKTESPIKLKSVKPEDFMVNSDINARVRVIEAREGQIVTREIFKHMKASNKEIVADTKQDVLKIANCSRYGNNNIGLGFIKGFGLKKGAIASSVAHDSHNIIVIGTNNKDMSRAVNQLVKMNGGLVAVFDREIVKLGLPIAGLMSDEPLDVIVKKMGALHKKTRQMGCRLSSPFMTMSFMALLVIPELKLSDRGLFGTKDFSFTELIYKKKYAKKSKR